MQVYLDGVVILNTVVDLLLILGTNRLTGFPPELRRSVAAAALGGIYAGLCLLPEFRFLGNVLWRMVFFVLITVVAFGSAAAGWRRGAIFFLLSMALGGIASGMGAASFAAVCLCALLVRVLCAVGIGRDQAGKTAIPVELNWQGRTVKLLALHDTGNMLRDPITGEQVLVCGADVGAQLLGLPESRFSDPTTLMTECKIPGVRLIPYHSVGQPLGMMAALRLNNAKIGNSVQNPLVAFAPHRIGAGDGIQMLTGGMLS